MSCQIKATPHHTRSSECLLELCVHTLQGFGNNLILTCHGWILSKTLLRHPISAYCIISFIPSWLNSGTQRKAGAWEQRSLTLAGRRGACYSCTRQASAVLPAAGGKAASVSLAPPLYVPGRSARLLPAGVRGAGPPAAPAYVYERTCEVGGGSRVSVPTQPGRPRSQVALGWGLGCPYQVLSTVSCPLWGRNFRGLWTCWIIAVFNESLSNLAKNEKF